MNAEPMTRADRETLIKIARQRERVAKSEAKERAAHLLADFEAQMDRQYSFDENEVWAKAERAAEEAVITAKKAVNDECERLGIPEDCRPGLSLGWKTRGRNTWKGSARGNASDRRTPTRRGREDSPHGDREAIPPGAGEDHDFRPDLG